MTAGHRSAWFYAALALGVSAACFERPQTRFPHELHLTRLACGGENQPECLDCTSCHADSHASDDGALREPRGVPDAGSCRGCHADAEHKLQASRPPALSPEPAAHDIAFSHELHLAMPAVRGQCVPCHSGAVDMTSTLFPPMQKCFECHEHREQFDAVECGPCHQADDVRRLVPQSFMAHDAMWLRHHGLEATREERMCSACHAQSECNDCHDVGQRLLREARTPENNRELVHPADFLTRHAMEAASQPGRCLTCHTPQTCDGCHVENGVSGQQSNPFNPHPPGWVGGNPASRDFHGQAARRDLLACASCHDQGPATNCIGCHRVGGYGGNPHPRGWQSARSEASSMCRYCHVQ